MASRRINDKLVRRFASIETCLAEDGRTPKLSDLDTMDALRQQAKGSTNDPVPVSLAREFAAVVFVVANERAEAVDPHRTRLAVDLAALTTRDRGTVGE